uniref:Calmodulin binding protein-like N-terminal domain-containing protein n=1 Tax=Lactuca sativa TaxID=4236 RepID=A0A9R1XA17_LACSA|nr:hypothetical protein LSAT_V11C500234900 [Lactuca sativa]
MGAGGRDTRALPDVDYLSRLRGRSLVQVVENCNALILRCIGRSHSNTELYLLKRWTIITETLNLWVNYFLHFPLLTFTLHAGALIFSDDVVVSPVFTRQKITGKNGGNESIKVILVDADTHEEITTRPMAFSKVKIVLLRGNYDGTTMEDGEFEKNIVVNWGKKKNILVGDVYVHLQHGTGTIGVIRIQHDKNPIRNVEFRLGAMVVDSSCPYEVKQAITQSFKVKDRRNAPKSFRSLSPTDKVWQLKNINMSCQRQKLGDNCNHAKTCNVVGNANYNVSRRLESTSQGSNIPSSFDNDCYFPQLYENDSFDHGKEMIMDNNLSIHDLE